MKKIYWTLMVISVFFISAPAYARNTGKMPVPIFEDAGADAIVSYNGTDGIYTYTYTIANPSSNTGEIWIFGIDIFKPPNSIWLSGAGFTIPYGPNTVLSFDERYNDIKNPEPMVPVGQRIPSERNWGGGIAKKGSAMFATKTGGGKIFPGETQGGFELISHGLPGIRDIEIHPDWIMKNIGSATPESAITARQVRESLTVTKKTIGPTAPPGSTILNFLALHERIIGYIDESITLGWLTDTALADNLRAKLTAARQFMDADDGTQAKTALGEFMTLLDNASAAQRTNEGYGLLYFNAKYLKDNLPDTVTNVP